MDGWITPSAHVNGLIGADQIPGDLRRSAELRIRSQVRTYRRWAMGAGALGPSAQRSRG